jgi:hypothetical protein
VKLTGSLTIPAFTKNATVLNQGLVSVYTIPGLTVMVDSDHGQTAETITATLTTTPTGAVLFFTRTIDIGDDEQGTIYVRLTLKN